MTAYHSRALACVAALTALSACAGSDPRGGGPPRGGPGGGPGGAMRGLESAMAPPIALLLTAADLDRDRTVTSQEASAAFDAAWTAADANADGRISAFEYEAWSALELGGTDVEPTRMTLDPDLDGNITPMEFKTRMGELFSNLDRNRDGALSRTELLVQPRPTPRGDFGGGGAATPRGGRRGGGPPGGDRGGGPG